MIKQYRWGYQERFDSLRLEPDVKFLWPDFCRDFKLEFQYREPMFVAVNADKPVWFILADISAIQGRITVQKLWVDKEFRGKNLLSGKGVAQELLDVVEEYAMSFHMIDYIYADVYADNVPAIAFFQKNWFELAWSFKHWRREKEDWKEILYFYKELKKWETSTSCSCRSQKKTCWTESYTPTTTKTG